MQSHPRAALAAMMPIAPRRPSLAELSLAMRIARREVQALRQAPVVPDQLSAARTVLLKRITAYTEELQALHLPIPPGLRDDLRLLQAGMLQARRTGTR